VTRANEARRRRTTRRRRSGQLPTSNSSASARLKLRARYGETSPELLAISGEKRRRATPKGEPVEPPRIDFSDIREASDEQLRAMRRVGRPPLGGAARQLIAIRVDPDVLERFRKEARRRKVGYQTLINEVLAARAGKDVA
jgi:uncharacterized protein (DUF4415 family)